MKKLILFCLILISGSAFSQVDVTFKVDMRGYAQPFVTANVNGTFNGWCGACNPMTDANADSIWEATISLPPGTIEYKFTVDGWTAQEMLAEGSPCTVTNSGFTNRVLTFTAATVVPSSCWGTCGACVPLGPQKLQIKLPITWQDTSVTNLTTSAFGGVYSLVDADPADATRLALKVVKTDAAETWAGTTLGTAAGFAANIPFSASSNQMQALVYSPNVGATVKLKAEDKADGTKAVETDAITTVANAWEVLTFNFVNNSTGTPAINYTYNYNKLSFFPNFGINGATAGEKTYFLGEVAFGTVSKTASLVDSKAFSVSPNPGNGIFELASSQFSNQNVDIAISDVTGRTVFSKSGMYVSGNVKVDARILDNGVYFVNVISGSKAFVSRLIVNK